MPSEGDQAASKLCPICHEDIDFFAYGSCNHPTCVKCILKLRKFGSADEPDFSKCPTCRRTLNMIVIMESFTPFDQVNTSSMGHDTQYDFVFPTQNIEKHYRDMLRSYCPICGEEKNSLSALNRHTTLEHQLSYCDLCIRYARLLPCEFVPMKPSDLVAHRKWDKQRRRGHPLCDFCEERFYEFEDLIHHIRDCHFLCDLCMTSGKFVVFREQQELLNHYGDSHHLCGECRAQQRISCFSTAEHLGIHRFQEHPDAVNNDPNSWMPISIELGRAAGVGLNRRRDRLDPIVERIDRVLSPSDGRLIAEGTSTGVRFRRPNPAEWTGEDFPALASNSMPAGERPISSGTGETRSTATSGSPSETTDNSAARQTNAQSASRYAHQGSTLAALAGGGRHTRLTQDDFPSLTGSENVKSNSAPTWIKTSSIGRASAINRNQQSRPRADQTLPTEADFPGLPQNSDRSVLGASRWVTQVAQPSEAPVTKQPEMVKNTPPTASDFPTLSGRSAPRAETATLAPFTRKSGLQPRSEKKSKRSVANSRTHITSSDQDPVPNELSRPQTTVRSRQHRNADIRFAVSNTLVSKEDDSDTERDKLKHIQTVETLPNSSIRESSTNATSVPTDWGPEEFPSLSGSTTSKSHPNSKVSSNADQKKKKMQEARKPPSNGYTTNQPRAATVESLVPKVSAESKTSPPTALKKSATTSNVSAHDFIDTECLLYANVHYFPAPNEEGRNRDLIRDVECELADLSGKTGFAHFADLSYRYRHKELTAAAYMDGLIGLLTPRISSAVAKSGDAPKPPIWFAQMLALLPDVGLQRALLRVLQGQGAPKLPADLLPPGCTGQRIRKPIPTPPSWAKAVLRLLHCCPDCGQVCLRTDMQWHLEQAHKRSVQ